MARQRGRQIGAHPWTRAASIHRPRPCSSSLRPEPTSWCLPTVAVLERMAALGSTKVAPLERESAILSLFVLNGPISRGCVIQMPWGPDGMEGWHFRYGPLRFYVVTDLRCRMHYTNAWLPLRDANAETQVWIFLFLLLTTAILRTI